MTQNKIYIYGKHALTEALTNVPLAVRHVYFAKDMQDKELRRLAQQSGVPIDVLDPRKVTSWVERNAPHQGVVALISLSSIVVPYEQWMKSAQHRPIGSSEPRPGVASTSTTSEHGQALILLNEVQDPHNVGAVIRSAAAFGANAVLLPSAKQSPVTGAVIKASAGMAFAVPLVSVANIQLTIADLKKRGFTLYGLAGDGKHSLEKESFDTPSVFVMGNESQGLQKTAKLCDRILSIPMEPHAESLNVAAAAAITLYQWHTKRR